MPFLGFGPPNVEKMRRKRDVRGLLRALRYPQDDAVRVAAADALGEVGGADAVAPLIAAAADDVNLRVAIVRALGQIGDERALEHLVAETADPRTHEAAVVALRAIYSPRAVTLLREMSPRDPSAQPYALLGRMKALDSLGEPQQARALAAEFIATIVPQRDYDDWTKAALETIVTLLAKIGDDTSVELLVRVAEKHYGAAAVPALTWIAQAGGNRLGLESWLALARLDRVMERSERSDRIVDTQPLRLLAVRALLGEAARSRARGQPIQRKNLDVLVSLLADSSGGGTARAEVVRGLAELGWSPANAEQRFWFGLANGDQGAAIAAAAELPAGRQEELLCGRGPAGDTFAVTAEVAGAVLEAMARRGPGATSDILRCINKNVYKACDPGFEIVARIGSPKVVVRYLLEAAGYRLRSGMQDAILFAAVRALHSLLANRAAEVAAPDLEAIVQELGPYPAGDAVRKLAAQELAGRNP